MQEIGAELSPEKKKAVRTLQQVHLWAGRYAWTWLFLLCCRPTRTLNGQGGLFGLFGLLGARWVIRVIRGKVNWCVRVCMRECVCMSVCMYVCVCVYLCVCRWIDGPLFTAQQLGTETTCKPLTRAQMFDRSILFPVAIVFNELIHAWFTALQLCEDV